jgi:CDP-glycerol glycerophosphotransferase
VAYKEILHYARASAAGEAIFVILGSSNPFPLFGRMDAFVLSSDYEGRPLVLYEAFALGLSVISTDIPGPAEVLNEGYGLVVENSVEGLVRGMQVALRGEVPQRPYDFEAHNRSALERFYKAVGV